MFRYALSMIIAVIALLISLPAHAAEITSQAEVAVQALHPNGGASDDELEAEVDIEEEEDTGLQGENILIPRSFGGVTEQLVSSGVAMTVNSIQRYPDESTRNADGEATLDFVEINITLENQRRLREVAYQPVYFRLYDTAGEITYPSFTGPAPYLNVGSLVERQRRTGNLLFVVPVETRLDYLVFVPVALYGKNPFIVNLNRTDIQQQAVQVSYQRLAAAGLIEGLGQSGIPPANPPTELPVTGAVMLPNAGGVLTPAGGWSSEVWLGLALLLGLIMGVTVRLRQT